MGGDGWHCGPILIESEHVNVGCHWFKEKGIGSPNWDNACVVVICDTKGVPHCAIEGNEAPCSGVVALVVHVALPVRVLVLLALVRLGGFLVLIRRVLIEVVIVIVEPAC